MQIYTYILSCATYQRAPRYGGERTWVEGSQARGNRMLAEASNLLSYKSPNCPAGKRLGHIKVFIICRRIGVFI